MEQISRIGMDTSKHFFQLHGVNAAEKVVLRKKLRRKEMVAFFKALAPTVIGIEACGASHHWARILRSFGHEAKLIAPQLVKPYVKRSRTVVAFLGQPAVADQRHRLLCATVLDRSVAEAGAADLGGVPSRAVDGDPICIAELSRRS